MLVNKLYLLLIVIVVILLCKNTIEGFKGYKYDGLNYSHCTSIPGRIHCELSDEDCIKDDFSGFKNEGEQCSVDGYSGTCITIQGVNGDSTVDKHLCNVTNDEINRIYQTEVTSNPPIDINPSSNYYTIKKINTGAPPLLQPAQAGQPTVDAYTHAPACSEDSSIASNCASLMEGEYVNCSNNRDCCLCNQSKWNKVYTSKNSDTPGNKLAQKSFNNIPLFNNVSDEEKIGYNIVKLDDTNKGNFTDRVSNDNFKRYFELPVGVSDKYYTPSKGYFFNQYNDNYQTEHVFDINEYPGYIKSGPCGNTDQPQCPNIPGSTSTIIAPGSTSIMSDFFYEECLYEKDDNDRCVCNNTSERSASGINPRNPNCIPCPSGGHIQAPGGQCVACSESNKVLDTRDGTCVTCDSLDYCSRYKCIYVKNEQGEGECHQIDLHENQVIRSDCFPKNTVDPADNCVISGTYHLSSDTSTLDDFYSQCSSNANCEVVQSIIDSTEGYINYNSPSVTTPVGPNVGTTGVNNDYNLITNEYCKSIDDQNKCDQIKHCEWKTDKCLLNIQTPESNLLSDNLYYIPLPNVFNNSLEISDCSSFNTGPNCTSPCEWTGRECINVDRCSISTPLPIEYESSLDGGIVNTELFDRNIKCKNLSSDRNHINDIKYDGDPTGFCLNDGTTSTMTPIGCLDSKELNDLFLHKSEDYINKVVTKAYLNDLINMRESGEQRPEGCISDITGDGSVDVHDLTLLLAAYNTNNVGDLDRDGVTNVNDLLLIIGEYGCPGSPEIQNIGITTNHNLIADHLLSDDCISDPSDPSNCNIDETKSSKLIDTCRELCENNPTKCNEYGVKFPTSVDDYSDAGCYLSKYCTQEGESDTSCIDQPCTGVNTPYRGCNIADCTGINSSGKLLPYPGCAPQECNTSDSDPHPGCLCSATYNGGNCIPQECTGLGNGILPYEGCLCSEQYNDNGATCEPRECTGLDDAGNLLPYIGCLCSDTYSPDGCILYRYSKISNNRSCQKMNTNTQQPSQLSTLREALSSEENCRDYCSADETCMGYEFNNYNNCYTWTSTPRADSRPGAPSGNCYKKDMI